MRDLPPDNHCSPSRKPWRTCISRFLTWVVLLAIAMACQRLRPEQTSIPEYPNLEALYHEQVHLLKGLSLSKMVTLGTEKEQKEFQLDSVGWAKELRFFEELNPSQTKYLGAFAKRVDGGQTTLTLTPNEEGAIKQVSFVPVGSGFASINISYHEEKEAFVHHKDVELRFEEEKLSGYSIDGYQKIVFKDTVHFTIEGVVQ